MDGEVKQAEVEEFDIPERESLKLQLATVTHNRDLALLQAAQARQAEAQASIIGINMQIKKSEALVQEAQQVLFGLITEGGRYDIAQPEMTLDAVKVKRKLKAPDALKALGEQIDALGADMNKRRP